ncbi:MAG: COQ9 family protein [Rhodobacterales bacterium]|nr:COQ9 family protein [Rhodobacterales bacterium]
MTKVDIKGDLLDAAVIHVPFDGWSDATWRSAIRDADVDPVLARALCPRGALDLAIAFHQRGDRAMVARAKTEDMGALRYSEKIAALVRFRLQAVEDKDVVRRGMTLFSLPQYASEGSKLIWGTSGLIWETLGDTSDDINWYTKRATLSAVYGSTVLFWLGDDSDDHQATWEFLDRRINDVMSIEKFKASVRDNKVLSGLLAGPMALLGRVKAPVNTGAGMPGRWEN